MTQDMTPASKDPVAVKAIVADFVTRVAASPDASDPEVAQRRQTLDDALASWSDKGEGNTGNFDSIEVVMRAASNLQVALYALNPEKLPFAYRDASDEVLSLIDELDAQGMDVTSHDVAYEPASADDETTKSVGIASPRMSL